jgi:hypothetical protein
MALVTLADFKLYVGTSSSSGQDALLQASLDAGEKEVLNFCKRATAFTGFEQSSGLTRYYRAGDVIDLPEAGGKSGPVLWLGNADLLGVDTLLNGDGTAISSTGYWLEPRHSTAQAGPAYKYLRLKSSESWAWDTDGEITITGTWGYSTAPDAAIVNAVKETAKYVYNLKDAQTYDVTAMPDIGQMTIPKGMPKHVETTLRKGGYVRTQGVY